MASPNSGSAAAPRPGNRRTHLRVPTRLAIDTAHEGRLVQIEAANIGEGGAYCSSGVEFRVMTQIEVRFDLPIDGGGEVRPIRVDAVVVRCEPHPIRSNSWSLALFFPHPSEAVRQTISRYVRARQSGGPGGEAPLDRADN